jgi:hypothetical protein
MPTDYPSQGRRLLLLPLGFTALLATFITLPQVLENQRLLWSFFAACALLFVWTAALFAAPAGRSFRTHFVLRRPHWLQPLIQGAVYVYWGWHWREAWHSAPLIVAQIVFGYAFDLLLTWTRRKEYELGFGVFPIVLSINLFLWFKPDWFWWQFVLVAFAFATKQLVRWTRDGRSAHIFNPSSFPLAVASVLLIATGTADHTFGNEIAVSLGNPLHIFEFLFLISVPGQLLFGVASMTMPAVVTAFLLGSAYTAITGTYFFFGTIPTAAFLGMLLLFTDPSTAPRSELGRVIYGALYGTSVFILYGVLDLFGQLTFYDKLLFVPFLNLGVQAIDRLAASPRLARLDPARYLKSLTGRSRNLAWTGAWTAAFLVMLALHGVGDTHPANRLPFWEEACDQGLRNGCRNLLTMETSFCEQGSGWACNEAGIRLASGTPSSAPDRARAQTYSFDRACRASVEAGCSNARALMTGGGLPFRAPPSPEDLNLMIENKGLPADRTTLQLWQAACDQGWKTACDSAQAAVDGRGGGKSAEQFGSACARGDKDACRALGLMYRKGDGVARDDRRAMACELGISEVCIAPR